MSLRIAWACYPTNVGLAIAANVFVYVGTIILYMVDWFFIQRIVRAQHTKIGWSTPYRIFHRGALALLVITLFLLIIGSIWQYFTLDSEKLDILHALFRTGQTYFTAFCLAPAVLAVLSLLIPRTEIEKFGAGRLRINIIILLVAVGVLSIGQIFRCTLAWIPPTPLQDDQGQAVDTPWYLHKACFYAFNFVTEIIVIIMFALVRVDLRFYVPNGSKMAGDYSARNSRCTVNDIDSEKNLIQPAPLSMTHQNDSSQTLHQYETSIFDDTHTLADSLKYGSSTLEVDQKTGNWKVKRVSTGSVGSPTSIHSSSASRSSLADRNTLTSGDVPPVPEIPSQWPLPDSAPPRSSIPLMEHSNPTSKRGTPKRTFEIEGHHFNNIDVGNAVTDALSKLEQNSEKNNLKSSTTPPPHYNCCTSPIEVYKPTLPSKSEKRASTCPTCRKYRKRVTYPPNAALGLAQRRSDTPQSSISETTTTPQTQIQRPEAAAALTSHPTRRSSSSLEIIALVHGQNSNAIPHRVMDVSLQGEEASTVAPSASAALTRVSSSRYSDVTTSSDAREYATAQDEFRRFSYESVAVVSPIREMRPQRRRS